MKRIILLLILSSFGASYRTENFIITAPTEAEAKIFAETSEFWWKEHHKYWFGIEGARMEIPCQSTLNIKTHSGGGATSFVWSHLGVDQPTGTWEGRRDKLLDDVIPHEVMHLVLAEQFRAPLPRWIDEGLCMSIESDDGRKRTLTRAVQNLYAKPSNTMTLSNMFRVKEYDQAAGLIGGHGSHMFKIVCFYDQATSIVEYLRTADTDKTLMEYIKQSMRDKQWEANLQSHYGINGTRELTAFWLNWVKAGSPDRQTSYKFGSRPWIFQNNSYCKNGSCPPRQPATIQQVPPAPPGYNSRPAPAAQVIRRCDCIAKIAALTKRIEELENREPVTIPQPGFTEKQIQQIVQLVLKEIPEPTQPTWNPDYTRISNNVVRSLKQDPTFLSTITELTQERLDPIKVTFQGANPTEDKIKRIKPGGELVIPPMQLEVQMRGESQGLSVGRLGSVLAVEMFPIPNKEPK